MNKRPIFYLVILMIVTIASFAQDKGAATTDSLSATTADAPNRVEMADALRSNGKIYVVVLIILIVFAGMIFYLFLMDKKVKKLENMVREKHQQTK
jgi:hypothetical protein